MKRRNLFQLALAPLGVGLASTETQENVGIGNPSTPTVKLHVSNYIRIKMGDKYVYLPVTTIA